MDDARVFGDVQSQYEVLGRQLNEAHLELQTERNKVERFERMLKVGPCELSEEYIKQLQKADDPNGDVSMTSDDIVVQLADELAKTREECIKITADSVKLKGDLGAGIVDARHLAAKLAADAESDEVRELRARVGDLERNARVLEAEYQWEYKRREAYSRELVTMRDMAFVSDVKARTAVAMMDGTYVVETDMLKWPKEQIIAKVQALEGVCSALYKDAYIEDRNRRIGLYLYDVRDSTDAISRRDSKIRELARLVRRFERLTLATSEEMERAVGSMLQLQVETLCADKVMLEVDIGTLKDRRAKLDCAYKAVDSDLSGLRDDMQRAKKEHDERASKVMVLQGEIERLTSRMESRVLEYSELDTKLSDLKGGSLNKAFEKLKVKARAEFDISTKSREITTTVMEGYEDKAREAAEWDDLIKDCQDNYEKLNEKIAQQKREMRDLDNAIAAKRAALHAA